MAKILILSANPNMLDTSSGGSERSFKLLESLTDHDVTVIAFSWSGNDHTTTLPDGTMFRVIAAEPSLARRGNTQRQRLDGKSRDLTIYLLRNFLSGFKNKVRKELVDTDLVILDHFATAPLFNELNTSNIPVVYASHNAEVTMAEQLYKPGSLDLQATIEMEKMALDLCDIYTYCSSEDAKKINDFYKVDKQSCYIPNGTEIRKIDLDINKESKTVLFVGSGHPPNVVAAKNLIPVAKALPEYTFKVVGDASNALTPLKPPSNVEVLGKVDDEQLDYLFRSASIFINPMESGSGTHLKMMKALSYGLPIVTSSVGARGFTEEERASCMLIGDNSDAIVKAIEKLSDTNTYATLVKNSYKLANHFNWVNIQKQFKEVVESMLSADAMTKVVKKSIAKKKILMYSIIRNREKFIGQYHKQILAVVNAFPEHEFYLSVYENDSTDKTRRMLFSRDWSVLKGVSIITENLNTKYFGSVKDSERVKNLSIARNKAIEAAGFINEVDYVLMFEGDVKFGVADIRELLEFETLEPDFDVVSAMSVRPNGTFYDVWATRTTDEYQPGVFPLEDGYKSKHYGRYLSTSSGLCLYRAKPFQEGARHDWINKRTGGSDCEMVVVCQDFRARGYDNIFINYKAKAYHS
jgi:glycosyltransferase involved in cell wall biosynthesis